MIHDIVAFDAGDGPRLYAAGEFAGSLACFDGKTWRLDTAGPRPGRLITDPVIRRLEVFDPDGDGPAPAEIIAAGNFASIGDQQIAFIARWDGAVWRSLGDGVNGEVTALAVIDRGDGPRLYVGGAFTTAGGMPAKRAAVWDGNSWAPLGEGFNERVTAFVPFDDGSSAPGIAVGGIFSEAAGQPAAGLAMWDGAALHVAGATLAPHRSVGKVAVIPNGEGGQQLVVAMSASETPSNAVRIFDGRRWTTIGLADNSVSELAWLDLGDGGALYVGGRFTQIGGVAALRIARWDGSAWMPLGDGIDGEVVSALAVFDDGAGPRLYAGGKFESAGGIPAAGLAAWDGAAWSVPTLPFPQGGVRSMAVFDPDGDGPEPRALYVGGQFVPTPEVPAFAIARWDGATWSALGSGLWHSKRPPVVYSLAVLDEDGDGPASPALYAAGSFTQAGSVLALNLARWNGTVWSAVPNTPTVPDHTILRMIAAPAADPSAPGSLLMLAHRDEKGLVNLVRWTDGVATVLGEVVGFPVSIAALDHDGAGPGDRAVYVAGTFTGVNGTASSNLARFSADAPVVFEDPRPLLVRPGATLRLSAGVSGAGPLAHQWRRAGQPLMDDGRITGAATPALSIRAVTAADAGEYDLVVTSPCGTATSAAAIVTLTCPADWNADGAATSADISAFLTAWFFAATSGTPGADFDASGITDSRDLSAFLATWVAAVQMGC